jgi:hypothetical protein
MRSSVAEADNISLSAAYRRYRLISSGVTWRQWSSPSCCSSLTTPLGWPGPLTRCPRRGPCYPLQRRGWRRHRTLSAIDRYSQGPVELPLADQRAGATISTRHLLIGKSTLPAMSRNEALRSREGESHYAVSMPSGRSWSSLTGRHCARCIDSTPSG